MVVSIKKLEEIHKNILLQRRELLEKKEEIKKIKKEIKELPERDEIIIQIHNIEHKIDNECMELLILARELYEISDRYRNTEKDIVRNYEERTSLGSLRAANILDFDLPIFKIINITL